MENIELLKDAILKNKNIVFFTGAGISVPSGIPDFRSSNGIYKKEYNGLNPEYIISRSFFNKNPKVFYDFYFDKMVYPKALPNKAHLFFSKLQSLNKNVTIITQNIDGLDKLAGNEKVIELHGSVLHNYCLKCHRHYSLDEFLNNKSYYCHCGGIIKPDVVLYEEPLKDQNIFNAIVALENADVVVVVGTSLTVAPASTLLYYYKKKDLFIINMSTTPFDKYAKAVYHNDVIKIIETLESGIKYE